MQSAFNSNSGTGRVAERRTGSTGGWGGEGGPCREGPGEGSSVWFSEDSSCKGPEWQEHAVAAGQEGAAVSGENRTLWLLLVKHFVFLKTKCLEFLV